MGKLTPCHPRNIEEGMKILDLFPEVSDASICGGQVVEGNCNVF